MVCKIWQHLTRNNKQTKVNSWHSFGIKHCNKITASELLNYSSQIDISKTVSWKFTETGEIIAIFSYCQHLRISIYTRWHTHTHQSIWKQHAHCLFPVTQWQMKEWLNIVSHNGHLNKAILPKRTSIFHTDVLRLIFNFRHLISFHHQNFSHHSLLHYHWCCYCIS